MSTCTDHFVTNCPICKAGFNRPAPIIPDPEVQQVIGQQTPIVPSTTASNTVTVSTTTAPAPQAISDPHATSVVDSAQTYALACEQVKDLTAKKSALELDLLTVKKDLLAATQVRDEAQQKLASLVTGNSSVDSHTKEQYEK